MKEELFIRFLNGECSAEEEQQVKQWAKEAGQQAHLERLMALHWKQAEKNKALENRHYRWLEKIHAQLYMPSGVSPGKNVYEQKYTSAAQSNTRYYLSIAASLLLILLAAWSYVYITQQAEEAQPIAHIQKITKKTGVGEKLTIRLPDGSRVTLNAASQITYPSEFSGSIRSVFLSGEAFLQVIHDAQKPFKVMTNHTETTVLGTQFNVNSRENEMITLVEGSVQVGFKDADQHEMIRLVPGQMAYTDALDLNMKVKEADLKEVTSWKDGSLVFRGVSLQEITARLENWYDVQITIAEGVDKDMKVSGEFNNENLQNILTGLSFSFDFTFTISNKNVMIK